MRERALSLDSCPQAIHFVVRLPPSDTARLAKHAYGLRVGAVEGQKGVIDERCSTIELRLEGEESLNVDGELIAAADLADAGVISFRAERDAFELIVG